MKRQIPAGDRRVLAAAEAVRDAAAEYRVAKREALRLYHEAQCDPSMPETNVTKDDRKRMKEVWKATGYDAAADYRNKMYRAYKRALRCVAELHPATLAGMVAMVELLTTADEEVMENLFCDRPSPLKLVLANLKRLAR